MPDFNSHIVQEANGAHFRCTCGVSTKIFGPSSVEIFACPACRRIYSASNYELYLKIPNQPTLKTRRDLPPMGATGKLGDRTFTVIGVANKREKHNTYGVWKEILLRDDLGTIHFLNCSYGHYTLLTRDYNVNADAMLKSIEEKYEHDGIRYQFFSTYNYQTTSLAGEFHYDVVDVKSVKCYDFLAPPRMIAIEKETKKAAVAYSGRHITRKEVAAMFSNQEIADQMYEGVGMAQPFYGDLDVKRFNMLSFIFLVFIVILGVFTGGKSKGSILWVDRTLNAEHPEQEFVTSPFRIYENQSPAYLEVSTSAGLSNQWAETQLTLVNEETGEEREYALGIEYYSGIDGGYSWAEGSQQGSIYISGVETGKYHLKGKVMYPTLSEPVSYRLTLFYASTSAWNIGMIIFPYLAFMIILNIFKRQFERMRTGEIDSLFGSANAD